MRLALFVIAGALALGGCVSPAEQAARDDATCQSYGAQQGTYDYMNCREQLRQQRNQALMAAWQAQQNNYNQQMANIRAMSQMYRPPASTNCTSSVIGNQVYTNCN